MKGILPIFCLLLFICQLQAQTFGPTLSLPDSLVVGAENPILTFEASLLQSTSRTVITADEILERGYDNLDELISSVQGLYITHDRAFTQIGIRGLSPSTSNNQRFLILLNDTPLNDPVSGQAPSGYTLQGIAMEDIAEVIIVRSPMNVLYGSNAMLGLISIKTKRLTSGVRLNFDVGSFGELDGGFAIGYRFGQTEVGISGRVLSNLGQDLYFPEFNGSVAHGDERNQSGFQFQFRRGRFALTGGYTQRDGRISNAPHGAAPLDDRGFYDGQQIFANLAYSDSIKDNQAYYTRVFANFNQQGQKMFLELFDTLQVKQQQEAFRTGFEYQHLYQFSDNHQLLGGVDFWYVPSAIYSQSSSFGLASDLNETYWIASVFAHDSYRINEFWSIQGGFRLSINSRTDPLLAPQLALSFSPAHQSTFRLGYNRGYRLPNLLETQVEIFGQLSPRSDLAPETINSVEFAWQQRLTEGLDFNLAFYYQELNNLIASAANSFSWTNSSTTNFAGLEGGLALSLPTGIRSYFLYNFQFQDSLAVNVPSPLCKLGVTLPFLNHFSLFVEGQYEGGRIAQNGSRTLPYFLMNTNLLIRPKLKAKTRGLRWISQSSLGLRVYNVLDQFYQHPASSFIAPDFIAQNGRTWQAQVTLQF